MPTWTDYIIKSHEELIKSKNAKDIGKMRAHASEYFVKDHLNNMLITHGLNGLWDCFHASETGDSDGNESGHDLVIRNCLTGESKRIQVKYRSGPFHLETTRRNSTKNKDRNNTGHVVYASDEFDLVVGICTNNTFVDNLPFDNQIVLIPVEYLKDPNDPTKLVPRVSKKVLDMCAKTKVEILKNMLKST